MYQPTTFTICTLEELHSFLQQYHEEIIQSTIKNIYNLGCTGYPEQPLYILTNHYAVNLFFGNELFITVYPKEYFLENLKENIFRPSSDPYDFDYIHHSERVNLKIQQVKPYIEHFGGCSHFVGIDILLADSKTLHVERDDLVPGASRSWLK